MCRSRVWLLLVLLVLLLHTEHVSVNLTVGRARRSAGGRMLPGPVAIFVAAAFVEMDKLLVTD